MNDCNVIENAACSASATSSQNDLMNFGSGDSRQLLTSDMDISTSKHMDNRKSESIFNDTMTNRLRRWSVTLVKGTRNTKTIYQKTIERMPSRIQKVLFPDSMYITHDAEHLDQITQEIEQNETLMDTFAEQLRIETIKSMPQTLSVKRDIKAKITKTVDRRSSSRSMNFSTRVKYSLKSYFTKSRYFVNSTIVNFEVWYNSMKEIEGHFGSGIGIYFKFLRSLLLMNIFLLVLVFGFVILPQIVYNEIGDMHGKAVIKNTNLTSLKTDDSIGVNNTGFSIMDLLSSEGYIKTTLLFYGSYTNNTFSCVKASKATYSLPFAYFLTMICLYILTFIAISCNMAQSYRKSFIQTSGNIENMLSHKVFCSWDWGIANSKAACLKHKNICSEFRELLEDISENDENEIQSSKLRRFWNVTSKITGHLLVLGLIFGIAYGMWIVLQWYNEKLGIDSTIIENTSSTLLLPLAVSLTMLVMQMIFKCLSFAEDYNTPRVYLHINLLRNFFMEFIIVSVLAIYWIIQGEEYDCWETKIGQEIYRFVVVDFFIATLGVSAMQMVRYILNKKLTAKIDLSEFDISRSCLGLVFNQTLLWMGLLFSPPLAAIICLKMFLTFYIKKFCVINFCRAPSKLWRSHQTHTLFTILLFLSLLGVVVAHIYIITQVKSSNICGPFRDHDYMYQVFMEGILKLKHDQLFFRILISITKPAVVAGVLLTLCVIVYYLRAKSKAQIAMVQLLKEMLYYEGKDKEFLLSNITKLTNDKDWLFSEDDINLFKRTATIDEVNIDDMAEPSSTWRYRSPKGSNQSTKIRQRFL